MVHHVHVAMSNVCYIQCIVYSGTGSSGIYGTGCKLWGGRVRVSLGKVTKINIRCRICHLIRNHYRYTEHNLPQADLLDSGQRTSFVHPN